MVVDLMLGLPTEVFTFNKRAVYFGKRKWSRGVTKVIKKIFAPSYRYTKLRRSGTTPRATGLPFRKARRRGKLVDTTLDKWVKGLKTRCRILEPLALIKLFESRHWSPVASQLVVAWREGRIATMIDLVLHDDLTDRILLVEIKSGCEYRNQSTGSRLKNMGSCTVTDAPLHQHQLQILLGKDLFHRTYPKCTKPVDSILIYVAKDGTLEVLEEKTDFTVFCDASVTDAILRTA
jgi:hypothetical protein